MDVLELMPGVDLLHSMRSVGYSFETAVADIVDNSITAGATHVWIQVDVTQGRWVAIRDDGRGMSQEDAREALRLAGTARTGHGGTATLGRFGLGLKTASLSQGRRLEVWSKQRGELVGLAWDIDTVAREGRWVVEVLTPDAPLSGGPDTRISEESSGTVVVWTKLDYLLGKAEDITGHLAEKVEVLRYHLGLVFHRFLQRSNALKIVLNGIEVEPVDPFLTSNTRTQRAPKQVLEVQGHPVALQGFTLPPEKYIPADARKRPDLGSGLRESQGFYVYRNQRLISHGGWLGLKPKEELTKQVRVQVDITDALDYLWQVDIRKARSEAPAEFKAKVRPLMDRFMLRGERLHSHRQRRLPVVGDAPYWRKIQSAEGVRFEINPEHPAVKAVRTALPSKERALFEVLLADLSEFFPYYDTYVATAKSQISESNGYATEAVRRRLVKLHDAGFSLEEVAEEALTAEPYREIPEIFTLMKEVWSDAAE
ncbi:ATP-binding protein [Micrococcus luteus]|uniref:ATP-binding protein n=2 Tax=Actinomycetes TaxID=1760 RepID=UPI0034255EE1